MYAHTSYIPGAPISASIQPISASKRHAMTICEGGGASFALHATLDDLKAIEGAIGEYLSKQTEVAA
jgi:hypothetical protein